MLAVHLATFLRTNLYNLFSLIQGYFKTNPLFFIAHFSHIVLFFVAARLILLYFGTGWLPWLVAVALATVSQVRGREGEREGGREWCDKCLDIHQHPVGDFCM